MAALPGISAWYLSIFMEYQAYQSTRLICLVTWPSPCFKLLLHVYLGGCGNAYDVIFDAEGHARANMGGHKGQYGFT